MKRTVFYEALLKTDSYLETQFMGTVSELPTPRTRPTLEIRLKVTNDASDI